MSEFDAKLLEEGLDCYVFPSLIRLDTLNFSSKLSFYLSHELSYNGRDFRF